MDHAEKENLLNIIQSDYIKYGDLVLKHPSSNIRSESTYIYNDSFNNAFKMGLMNSNDILLNLMKLGIWTIQDENQIQGLKDDIFKIKKGLLEYVFQKDKLERMRKLLRNAENVLIDKLIRRSEFTKSSIENYAFKMQQKFIICNITFLDRKNRKWDKNSFDCDKDIDLIDNLCNFYFNTSRFRPNIIREIARTEPWRGFWKTAKNLNIFGKSPRNWSYNQVDLAKWSDLYDAIYNAYERPSEMIINDDDLLDSWLIKQSEESDAKCKGSQIKDNLKKPIKGKREVFVMTDASSAKDIYAANDISGKIAIKSRNKVLESNMELADQFSPDSQKQLKEIATNQSKQKRKSISSR